MKIYRCAICGYIYKDKNAPCECPFCRNSECFDEVKEKHIDFSFFKDAWERQVRWMNATHYQIKIKLNTDETILKDLADAMKEYLLHKGQAYCPCRVLTGKAGADRKIICPCYFYMGEVELQGRCHCSLFLLEKGD